MRCITDTNIWVDLDHGELIEAVFELNHAWEIPDLVAEELETIQLERLVAFGLTVRSLTGEQLEHILSLAEKYARPSRPDLAGLVLARDEAATLVTGDAGLRDAATAEGIDVHGLLWVLDGLVEEELVSEPTASISLRWMIHLGARLPRDEVERRLEIWGVR